MTKDLKRKLSAILSTDVQGYSRLMGSDEDSTVKAITVYRREISYTVKKHHGRVVDSPGDNLLAEFASVVDAVECAVNIQETIKEKNKDLADDRKMLFRIGINLGDVIDKGKRIYGDTINIAARLEGLADGGGICISGTAYEQVRNKLKLKYAYMGEQSVKNISRPVRAYKILVEPSSTIPMLAKQKLAIMLYVCASMGFLYFLFIRYLRFIMADQELLPLLSLSPMLYSKGHLFIPVLFAVIILCVAVFLLIKKNLPVFILRFFRGGFFFSIGFFLVYLVLTYLPFDFGLDKKLFESRHLFVEILEQDVPIHEKPNQKSKILQRMKKNRLLLLTDFSKKGALKWNKVLIGKKKYGWVMRTIPPKFGAAEKRLSSAGKFSFTYLDLCPAIAGLFCFICGFLSFRLRTD